eukprot:Ihof_evm4s5 gene=Ihof_evmTU4s5
MQAADYQRLLQQFPVVRNKNFQSRTHLRPVPHKQISHHNTTFVETPVATSIHPTAPPSSGLSPNEGTAIKVIVKSLKGCEYTIEVRTNDRVSHLKSLVEGEAAIPVERQRLILKGKALNDDDTIREAGVTDGTKLHLIIRSAPKITSEGGSEVVVPPTHKPLSTDDVVMTDAPSAPVQEPIKSEPVSDPVQTIPAMQVPSQFWDSLYERLCAHLAPAVAKS